MTHNFVFIYIKTYLDVKLVEYNTLSDSFFVEQSNKSNLSELQPQFFAPEN